MPTPRVHSFIAATALLAASLSLTACEAPQVEEEAGALVQELVAIDGVSAVDVAYEDLGGWENDEVDYSVEVAPDADADTVAGIAAAVYAAVHDDDAVGDAAVSATLTQADDQLRLRIFRSNAEADEVATVVAALVPRLADGRTFVEVDTSMRKADEPLDLTVNQVLVAGTTGAEVQECRSGWETLIDRVGRGGVYVESA